MNKEAKVPADRILVTPMEAEHPAHGLAIIQKVKQKPSMGKVLLVGRDVIDVVVGDIVTYGPHSGNTIMIGDETKVLLREPEIYVINP